MYITNVQKILKKVRVNIYFIKKKINGFFYFFIVYFEEILVFFSRQFPNKDRNKKK